MGEGSQIQPQYLTKLLDRGAPLKQTSKLKIKYTKPNFQTNSFDADIEDSGIAVHTMRMKDSIFVWIGKKAQPEFTDLSLGMVSNVDKTSSSVKVVGAALDMTSVNLANRLTKKFNKQVYVSSNVQLDLISLPFIEKCIMEDISKNTD